MSTPDRLDRLLPGPGWRRSPCGNGICNIAPGQTLLTVEGVTSTSECRTCAVWIVPLPETVAPPHPPVD